VSPFLTHGVYMTCDISLFTYSLRTYVRSRQERPISLSSSLCPASRLIYKLHVDVVTTTTITLPSSSSSSS